MSAASRSRSSGLQARASPLFSHHRRPRYACGREIEHCRTDRQPGGPHARSRWGSQHRYGLWPSDGSCTCPFIVEATMTSRWQNELGRSTSMKPVNGKHQTFKGRSEASGTCRGGVQRRTVIRARGAAAVVALRLDRYGPPCPFRPPHQFPTPARKCSRRCTPYIKVRSVMATATVIVCSQLRQQRVASWQRPLGG